MRGRWSQLRHVASTLLSVALLTVALPVSAEIAVGREGESTASRGAPSGHATIHPQPLQSTTLGGNDSRLVQQREWRRQEIKEFVLNSLGRKNGSPQPNKTNETQEEDDASPRHNGRHLVGLHGEPVPSNGADEQSSVKNTRNSRAQKMIKFTPDTVSSGKNDDVLVIFFLQNYTGLKVEEAELAVLLRCRPLPTNQSGAASAASVSGKPIVRRITIVVYRDLENGATSSGNESSVERSSKTTSVFQIRRTKWVKVLLMRRWVEQALSSPSRTLRLRLVYDKSGSIEVVTTNRTGRRRGAQQTRISGQQTPAPPTPAPGVAVGARRRQLKELRRSNRKRKTSPILVVVKREERRPRPPSSIPRNNNPKLLSSRQLDS